MSQGYQPKLLFYSDNFPYLRGQWYLGLYALLRGSLWDKCNSSVNYKAWDKNQVLTSTSIKQTDIRFPLGNGRSAWYPTVLLQHVYCENYYLIHSRDILMPWTEIASIILRSWISWHCFLFQISPWLDVDFTLELQIVSARSPLRSAADGLLVYNHLVHTEHFKFLSSIASLNCEIFYLSKFAIVHLCHFKGQTSSILSGKTCLVLPQWKFLYVDHCLQVQWFLSYVIS